MVAWADNVTVASPTDRSLAVIRETVLDALSITPLSVGRLSVKLISSHLELFTRSPVMTMSRVAPVASVYLKWFSSVRSITVRAGSILQLACKEARTRTLVIYGVVMSSEVSG